MRQHPSSTGSLKGREKLSPRPWRGRCDTFDRVALHPYHRLSVRNSSEKASQSTNYGVVHTPIHYDVHGRYVLYFLEQVRSDSLMDG